ncbi:MAG: FtsQ-type POTRA domain-containing protein [Holophagales bacterium]|nr:FtsQ-type POTRA domain-containing protein [Holophagales bacterium]
MADDPRILQFRRQSEPPSERAAWIAQAEAAPPEEAPGRSTEPSPEPRQASGRSPSGAFPLASPGDVQTPTLLRRRRTEQPPSSPVLPFRRRRGRRVRRLRRNPFVRIAWPLFLAIAIVGTPVALMLWFAHSPLFALRGIEASVEEGGRVTQEWVEKALRPYQGENVWLVSLDEMALSLARHPWVADIGLRKRPPNDLVVRVVERREVALLRTGIPAGTSDGKVGALVFLDGSGRPIAPLSTPWQRPGIDLPIISGGSGTVAGIASAVGLLREIEAAAPPWIQGLSEIEILSDTDYRVHTADLPFPLLLRAGTVDDKNRRLEQLLPRIAERFDAIAAVDLRFSRRIIIERAARDRPPQHARAT